LFLFKEGGMAASRFYKATGDWLILAFKGAVVGTGAILPGVSGGVLCVAFGIYEPMMALLSHPLKAFKRYGRMFIPFLIGWIAGFMLLAKAVEALFNASSAIALALFAGLICGAIPELMKQSERSGPKQSWSAFILPMIAAYALLRFLQAESLGAVSPSPAWYTFCGVIWGLSLVIPGLSSSSILIYMGLYQPMTAGIAKFDFTVILPLLAGLLITVVLTARLVNYLFEKNRTLMSRIILGVMLASTLLIVPVSFPDGLSIFLSVICFEAGFLLARWMDVFRTKRMGDN
jgi:putative membrane protein